MSLIKNEFPILEYDTDERAVIMPDHDELEIHLPKKAVFAFLGDAIDQYAKECGAKIVGKFSQFIF